MKRIELCVPDKAAVAAIMDIRTLCGNAQKEQREKDGLPYTAVIGFFSGNSDLYFYLKENWNTYAQKVDPLYGTIGFFDTEVQDEEYLEGLTKEDEAQKERLIKMVFQSSRKNQD